MAGRSKESATTRRAVPDVEPPARDLLKINQVFGKNGKPQPAVLKKHFMREGRLDMHAAVKLVEDTIAILRKESTVLDVKAPATVCGDIHGQFYDLVKLFEVGGAPGEKRYLFLGDYVDRGHFSCECVFLLFSYKILFPDAFFLLRGNHECRHLSEYFTFKTECKIKYSVALYDLFMKSFDCLPLAAVLNKQYLCIHGGLSPELHTINDIRKIDRFREPPPFGPMCDLLWADPTEDFGSERNSDHFSENTTRGCSFFFSFAASCQFLRDNQLLSIIRAHEAQDQGYRMYRKNEKTGFPALFTIFSAPNYLDTYFNRAAIMTYEASPTKSNTTDSDFVLNIKQFGWSPHPYWLPNFTDVFTWSLPFVGEQVLRLLATILNICSEAELREDGRESTKNDIIKSKIISVARMSNVFNKLRQESQMILDLKGLTPSSSTESLPEVSEDLKRSLHDRKRKSFEEIRNLDKVNEKMPLSMRSASRSPEQRK